MTAANNARHKNGSMAGCCLSPRHPKKRQQSADVLIGRRFCCAGATAHSHKIKLTRTCCRSQGSRRSSSWKHACRGMWFCTWEAMTAVRNSPCFKQLLFVRKVMLVTNSIRPAEVFSFRQTRFSRTCQPWSVSCRRQAQAAVMKTGSQATFSTGAVLRGSRSKTI